MRQRDHRTELVDAVVVGSATVGGRHGSARDAGANRARCLDASALNGLTDGQMARLGCFGTGLHWLKWTSSCSTASLGTIFRSNQ
eukprot:scaffold4719_cov314-Pinguiococcus_pyrenoidosus.AAC.8